jgi:hypothetical protein
LGGATTSRGTLQAGAEKDISKGNDHSSPCEEEDRQNRAHEVLERYRRQSEEGRMELVLRRNCGFTNGKQSGLWTREDIRN